MKNLFPKNNKLIQILGKELTDCVLGRKECLKTCQCEGNLVITDRDNGENAGYEFKGHIVFFPHEWFFSIHAKFQGRFRPFVFYILPSEDQELKPLPFEIHTQNVYIRRNNSSPDWKFWMQLGGITKWDYHLTIRELHSYLFYELPE